MEELQVYVENNMGSSLEHDYNLTTGGAVSTLKHSQNVEWTEPGKTALTLTDDGNGVKLKFPDKKIIELDYNEAREALIVLMMNMDSRIEIRHSEIIKTI